MAKCGLPVPEHTLSTGTDAPDTVDNGQVVLVVVGAMVVTGASVVDVADACPAAEVDGAVAAVVPQAAVKIANVENPATQRIRGGRTSGA